MLRSSKRPNVLVVSAFFGDAAMPGGFRWAGLCAGLEEQGVAVKVLHAHGTPMTNYGSLPTCGQTAIRGAPAAGRGIVEDAAQRSRWIRMLGRHLPVPDRWILWAVRAGRLCWSTQSDVLVVTVPPFSLAMIIPAIWAKRAVARSDGPLLVLDFRDAWTAQRVRAMERRKSLQWRVDQLLERWAVAKADAVIFASEGTRREYARRHPHRSAKMHTVPNPAPPLRQGLADARQVVAHVGAVDPRRGRDLGSVLRSWSSLRASGRVSEWELQFYGSGLDQDASGHVAIDAVKFFGRISQAEALNQLRAAGVVLVIGSDDPFEVPMKFWEAVASRRPVVVVAPEASELFHEARRWELVFLGRRGDDHTIVAALADAVARWTEERPSEVAELVGPTARSRQFIEAITACRSAGPPANSGNGT